jgi:hypothetical protein
MMPYNSSEAIANAFRAKVAYQELNTRFCRGAWDRRGHTPHPSRIYHLSSIIYHLSSIIYHPAPVFALRLLATNGSGQSSHQPYKSRCKGSISVLIRNNSRLTAEQSRFAEASPPKRS